MYTVGMCMQCFICIQWECACGVLYVYSGDVHAVVYIYTVGICMQCFICVQWRWIEDVYSYMYGYVYSYMYGLRMCIRVTSTYKKGVLSGHNKLLCDI